MVEFLRKIALYISLTKALVEPVLRVARMDKGSSPWLYADVGIWCVGFTPNESISLTGAGFRRDGPRRMGSNHAGFLDVVVHGSLLRAGFWLCLRLPEVEVTG